MKAIPAELRAIMECEVMRANRKEHPGRPASVVLIDAQLQVETALRDALRVVKRHEEVFPQNGAHRQLPRALRTLEGKSAEEQDRVLQVGLRNNIAQVFANIGVDPTTTALVAADALLEELFT